MAEASHREAYGAMAEITRRLHAAEASHREADAAMAEFARRRVVAEASQRVAELRAVAARNDVVERHSPDVAELRVRPADSEYPAEHVESSGQRCVVLEVLAQKLRDDLDGARLQLDLSNVQGVESGTSAHELERRSADVADLRLRLADAENCAEQVGA